MFHISKLTSQILARQEISSQETPDIKPFLSFPQSFACTIENYRKDKRRHMLIILNYLLKKCFTCKEAHMMQDTIAEVCDITREHANVLLHEMMRLGWIIIINRGVKRSCVYKVNESFFAYRQELAPYLKVLSMLGIWMLVTFNTTMNSAFPTQPIPQNKNLSININTVIERGSQGHRFMEILKLSSNRKTVNHVTTAVVQNIAANLRLTSNGALMISAFDDKTLQTAYDVTRKYEKAQRNFEVFYAVCQRIAQVNKLQPRYSYARNLLDAAGYQRGMPLMADEDAQPRYDKPQPKVESAQLTDKASGWLKSFNSEKVLDKLK